MANLINSMTNDKLSQLNGSSVSTKELGKLTKLVNEIKLIEGFQPIKLTGNRQIFIDNKPAQLLEARTLDNKSFSMISEQLQPTIDKLKQVGLTVDSKNKQFTLSFNDGTDLREAKLNKNPTQGIEGIIYKNNNLEASSQARSVNKHYQNQATVASDPRPNVEQSKQYQSKEIAVRLASKVEFINVIAKLPSQDTPRTTPPNQNSSQIGAQLEAQSQVQKTDISVNSYSKITPKTSPQALTQREPTASINSNNTPIQSLVADAKTPQSETETQQRQSAQSQSITTQQDKSQAYISKPHLTDFIPKQVTKPISSTQTGIPQEQSQLNAKPIQTLSSNQVKSSQGTSSQLTGAPNLNFKPSYALIGNHQEKPENSITQEQVLRTELTNKSNQYKVSQSSQNFIIESLKPLNVGDTIPVIRDENGKLQLLPITQEMTNKTLDSGLAKSLPQQLTKGELSQLIQTFNQLQNNREASKDTQRLIQQILTSIPQSQNIESPKELKQALSNSGLFLENKLLKSSDNLNHDFKANLLKLQTNIAQSESTSTQTYIKDNLDQRTGQTISQAIERITSSQIRNLLETNKVEGLNLPLTIEFPIQDKGATSIFQLQVDKDSDSDTTSTNKRRWLAKLLFDFPETGKFEARLNVEGNKLAVIFVAEEKETANKIHQYTQNLTKQLTNKGLEVTQVDSFCKPVEDKVQTKVKRNLIDVRT
ncbi:MAG: flagellar hook-length control protein FliK [Marinomonas sp.]